MTKQCKVCKVNITIHGFIPHTIPVISQVNSIRIEHGSNLEDQVVSQYLCNWMVAHEEINYT